MVFFRRSIMSVAFPTLWLDGAVELDSGDIQKNNVAR